MRAKRTHRAMRGKAGIAHCFAKYAEHCSSRKRGWTSSSLLIQALEAQHIPTDRRSKDATK